MKRTNIQNKQLYALIYKLGITLEIKSEMILDFTDGRTEKSSEMTYQECQQMIDALNMQLARNKQSQRSIANSLRRKVFTLFYDLNWISSDMVTSEKLTIINDWIFRKTKSGKNDLNKLTAEELNTLLIQLRAVKRNTDVQKKKIAQKNRIKSVAVGVHLKTNYGSYMK